MPGYGGGVGGDNAAGNEAGAGGGSGAGGGFGGGEGGGSVGPGAEDPSEGFTGPGGLADTTARGGKAEDAGPGGRGEGLDAFRSRMSKELGVPEEQISFRVDDEHGIYGWVTDEAYDAVYGMAPPDDETHFIDRGIRNMLNPATPSPSLMGLVGWAGYQLGRKLGGPVDLSTGQRPGWSHRDFDAEADAAKAEAVTDPPKENGEEDAGDGEGYKPYDWMDPEYREKIRREMEAIVGGMMPDEAYDVPDWQYLGSVGTTGEPDTPPAVPDHELDYQDLLDRIYERLYGEEEEEAA